MILKTFHLPIYKSRGEDALLTTWSLTRENKGKTRRHVFMFYESMSLKKNQKGMDPIRENTVHGSGKPLRLIQ